MASFLNVDWFRKGSGELFAVAWYFWFNCGYLREGIEDVIAKRGDPHDTLRLLLRDIDNLEPLSGYGLFELDRSTLTSHQHDLSSNKVHNDYVGLVAWIFRKLHLVLSKSPTLHNMESLLNKPKDEVLGAAQLTGHVKA